MKTRKQLQQAAFNKVWRHFVLKKNPQCIEKSGSCVYHKRSGAGCAIGILLPPAIKKQMTRIYIGYVDWYLFSAKDGKAMVHQGRETIPSMPPEIQALGREFGDALQSAHDFGATPEVMKSELQRVARDFKLTIPSR